MPIPGYMVGAERFELPTLWSQTRCATRLRYAPKRLIIAGLPDDCRTATAYFCKMRKPHRTGSRLPL